MEHITAPELAAWIADPERPSPLLLDVREPWEHDTCKLEAAQLMPMNTIPGRFAELDEEQPVVCICHHGARSMQVAAFSRTPGLFQRDQSDWRHACLGPASRSRHADLLNHGGAVPPPFFRPAKPAPMRAQLA